ncbi:MAG: hypothetical protein HQL56_09810 [Magnetococcales bacterium]|nr:hypothetical protein [Magnetococcales bacterium]
MAKSTLTLIGGGKTFIGPADGTGPMRYLGDISKVELTVSEDKKTLANFTTPGGGVADSITLIKEVTLAITAQSFDVENLALATFGETGDIASGSITDESHLAYKGGYIRTANGGVGLSGVVVKKGVTTLVAGTDYEVLGGGIRILPTTSAMSNGDTITLDYDYGAARSVEAILNAGKDYSISFDGFNQANDSTPVVLDVWRVRNAPTAVSLVGDNFGNLEFKFDVLMDASKTGAGTSKFFRLVQVEV